VAVPAARLDNFAGCREALVPIWGVINARLDARCVVVVVVGFC
jgi:hypothetical protein